MATHPLWSDDYWLLLMQLYQKKPAGVKSEYSHAVVELGIELHIPPRTLHEQMRQLERHDTPALQRLWDTYADNARRLARDVKRLRQMSGFGCSDMFYEGVATTLPFERDYRPICPQTDITPVMLTIVLSLYFELTPNTMVSETPEVLDTARLLGIKPEEVVEILDIYQTFDPILKRQTLPQAPVTDEARRIWQRFYNGQPEQLQTAADRLKEYFEC